MVGQTVVIEFDFFVIRVFEEFNDRKKNLALIKKIVYYV